MVVQIHQVTSGMYTTQPVMIMQRSTLPDDNGGSSSGNGGSSSSQ
ncbi:hypothetical protein [Leuconostoc citreum]|nr:hypothetical protein [Leuconostoc citreum]